MPWFELTFINGQLIRIEADTVGEVAQCLEDMQPGLAQAVIACVEVPAEVSQ